jgi:hypothetical protein
VGGMMIVKGSDIPSENLSTCGPHSKYLLLKQNEIERSR